MISSLDNLHRIIYNTDGRARWRIGSKMIELGKVQELEVVRIKDFGVYLSEGEKSESSVLLPKNMFPKGQRWENG